MQDFSELSNDNNLSATKIRFRQKRNFSELLNATFGFIKIEFKYLIKFVLVFLLPFITILTFMQTSMLNNIMGSLFFTSTASTIIFAIAMLVFFLVFGAFVLSAAFAAVTNYRSGKENTLKNMLGQIKIYLGPEIKMIFAFIGLSIIYGLIIAVSSFMFSFLAQISFVFTLIFILVLYSLTIMMVVKTSLSFSIKAFEHGQPTNDFVFTRSMKLIKKHWWETFGGIFIITFIVGVITMLFSLISGAPTLFSFFTGSMSFSRPHPVLLFVLQFIGNLPMLLNIIIPIFLSFQYFNMIEEKEGGSLLERVDGLNPDADIDRPLEDETKYMPENSNDLPEEVEVKDIENKDNENPDTENKDVENTDTENKSDRPLEDETKYMPKDLKDPSAADNNTDIGNDEK